MHHTGIGDIDAGTEYQAAHGTAMPRKLLRHARDCRPRIRSARGMKRQSYVVPALADGENEEVRENELPTFERHVSGALAREMKHATECPFIVTKHAVALRQPRLYDRHDMMMMR